MNKSIKIMIFMVVIAIILILPLSAQITQPYDLPSSNTLKSTAGVFGSEVDDYMDVNYFSGVEFSKWFGYITGSNDYTPPAFVIDLGYATVLGAGEEKKGTYLGTRYIGNILRFTGTATKQVDVTYPNPSDGNDPTQILTTTSWPSGTVFSSNQAEALIGIGGMGFKLGFFEQLTTSRSEGNPGTNFTKNDDKANGRIIYTNKPVDYSTVEGTIKPSLLWGMNKELGSNTVRPYAGFAFGIYQDKSIDIRKTYTVFTGTKTKIDPTKTYGNSWNRGYLQPDITLGAWVDMPKEKYDLSLGLGYNLKIDAYSNDYDAPGVSGIANGTVNWTGATRQVTNYLDRTVTVDTTNLRITEKSAWDHSISPSLKVTRDISGVKLGFTAGLPITINAASDNVYSDAYTITKTRYNLATDKAQNTTVTQRVHSVASGNLTETTTFNIAPELGIGAQYELVAKRFTVNAGVSATPLDYTNTTTKISTKGEDKTYNKTVDGYGKTTVNNVTGPGASIRTDSVEVEDIWGPFSCEARAGFVFNFTENFATDLNASVGTVNTFRTALTTVNILFVFKF